MATSAMLGCVYTDTTTVGNRKLYETPFLVTPMETEIYSIDSNGTFVIFGGNNQVLNIAHNDQVSYFDGAYSDSIVYTKFFDSSKFYVVTMDGTIDIMELVSMRSNGAIIAENALLCEMNTHGGCEETVHDGDACSENSSSAVENRQEHGPRPNIAYRHGDQYLLIKKAHQNICKDITSVTHHRNILLLGCGDGCIHVFYKNLQYRINLEGHKTEINGLSILNNYIFSSSASNFIVYKNNFVVYNHKTDLLKGMHVIDGRAYLVYKESISVLKCNENETYRGVRAYNEDDYDKYFSGNIPYCGYVSDCFTNLYNINVKGTECIAKINDDLVIGGEFLVIISQGKEYRTEIKDVNLLMVRDSTVIFTTLYDQIGVSDYRGEHFTFYDTDVGLVYDMTLDGNMVYVAGESGMDHIDVEIKKR